MSQRQPAEPDASRADVLLSDGGIATIRPVTPADEEQLVRLNQHSSDRSIQRRFFSLNREIADGYARRLAQASGADALGLVAEIGDSVIAVAVCERLTEDTAEVAFLVDDDHQGRGVGTLLLGHLAARARAAGIHRFAAITSSTNAPMIRVFRDAGFEVRQSTTGGLVDVTMGTDATEAAIAAADARARVAAVHSLRRVLRPQVVAVAGAGRRPGGVGRAVLDNIRAAGFTGRLYAVHPVAAQIGEVDAYPTVAEIPDEVELLVVAVPADQVVSVISDAAAAGVPGAVVLTAGLGEIGEEGATRQREMVRVARRHGMRIIGPNCLGVLNPDPDIRLDATFAAVTPPPGRLAIASQSGGVGIAMLDAAARGGLGIAGFVSLGNKADVSGNDLVEIWTEDDLVAAGGLYLESFGNARKFARVARRMSERKPLLAVVGGRSEGGRRAGASHTAAAAAPTVAVEAMFAQSGVIGVASVSELVDTARVLLQQPLPAGRRLAVVGNAGGLGVLAADAANATGLVVPQLSPELRTRLAEAVPGAAGLDNPLDLAAAASPHAFEAALRVVLTSGEVDAAVVIFTATKVGDTAGVLGAIARATGESPGPTTVGVLIGVAPDEASAALDLPVFPTADAAVTAIAHAARYAEWKATPRGVVPDLADADQGAARRLVDEVLTSAPRGRWMHPQEAVRLLAAYGVPTPRSAIAGSARQAGAVARALGYPVVAKVANPDVVHKTDLGLVVLGISSAAEMNRTYRKMAAMLEDPRALILVQQQVETGVELALGVVRDPTFGPLVMVAAGGVTTDVLDDRAFLLPPVTPQDARRAVEGLRMSPLLRGFRGAQPADVAGLEDVVVRIGRLTTDVPEVVEMDLNPVMVTPTGVCCVDVKIRLEPYQGIDDAARPAMRAPG